jgi:hypothetical protein
MQSVWSKGMQGKVLRKIGKSLPWGQMHQKCLHLPLMNHKLHLDIRKQENEEGGKFNY